MERELRFGGLRIELEPGESPSTVKRRLAEAAQQLGNVRSFLG